MNNPDVTKQPVTPDTSASVSGCSEHVHFGITTPKGARATVLGDPNMPERTRNAIAVMLDAADAALKSGKLKAKDNGGAKASGA